MKTESAVRIWEEDVTIPTYDVGIPNRNPMFLEKRVYQGSSGVVYPYPVIDTIADEKRDRIWRAVYLENEYLKVMILPALGGRVQMALDKTNNYHFVYHNTVIKPALVGLAGPWISGGIEFNWPQHHRPSTYLPTEYTITEDPDGSRTLWVSEIERMSRLRGMVGFTLYPDRAILELRARLYNHTEVPQTFLWWANPAVAVNDDYQSVFPPDVRAVMDHGKRDVSDFPIATGTYYKVDYSAGVDISRYGNIPVPTSYMAYHSDYDFVGGYDHGRRAGLLHVADHHISPGKKLWTWGCGDFGKAWNRHLTDEDGPYIELMCGVYTDNQPDFSWLSPYEEKAFMQVFMPYKDIGVVKNAGRDGAISMDIGDGVVYVGAYATTPHIGSVLRLTSGDATIGEWKADLSPHKTLMETVPMPPDAQADGLRLVWLDGTGREVLAYQPAPEAVEPAPKPARAAPPPKDIGSIEDLYLTGLHLEQYRHATRNPDDYYREALKREPGDARCNNAMGLRLYRRGEFAPAEAHFRRAIATLTQRNPNPFDGEPFYNLGLALMMQGRYDHALDAFHKATWNAAWQDPACFQLARIASRQGRFDDALELAERSLVRNARNQKARHIKTALLRNTGRCHEAEREAVATLAVDPLDLGALVERCLLAASTGDDATLEECHRAMKRALRGASDNYIEIALDYAYMGLYAEAITLLGWCIGHDARQEPGHYRDPMVLYYLGWFWRHEGDEAAMRRCYAEAAAMPADYGFPSTLEAMLALKAATKANPEDARAWYYLGNLFHGKRRHEDAIAAWETARETDPAFPTAHRNLALAYANVRRDLDAAHTSLTTAFTLDPTDARVLYELDQLDKKRNREPGERYARLAAHPTLVEARDDLYLEYVTLLNRLGRHGNALQCLARRRFHPWEGGEGKVTAQYVLARVETAKALLARNLPEEAVENLQAAMQYPENLGEGKLPGARENHIHYWLGRACRDLGDEEKAREALERAAKGDYEPAPAVFYNDQPPEMIFYQGLALRALGCEDAARDRFRALVEYGESHLSDDARLDYFAVSLPDFLVFDDDLNARNRIHCHYLMGLGRLGFGDADSARAEFDTVLAADAAHTGAWIHRAMAERT